MRGSRLQRLAALALAGLGAGLLAGAPATASAASPSPETSLLPSPTTSASPTPHASPTPVRSPTPTPRTRPTPGLAGKAGLLSQVDHRLATVHALRATVSGARVLTADHSLALTAQLDAAAAGLTGLARQIAGETDAAALRREAAAVVDEYRVDDLLAPKVHLAVAADGDVAGAGTLTGLGARFRAEAARQKAAGHDTASAEADLSDLSLRVAGAMSAAGPIPAAVLPLTAAGFPANRTSLVAARADLQTAGRDLHLASEDAHRAAQALSLLSVAELRATGTAMITERLAVLSRLAAQIRASAAVTDSDREQLLTLVEADRSGLSALQRRLQSETDARSIEADVAAVLTDYRIYALVVPKVELVLAAATLEAEGSKMESAARLLGARVAAWRRAGHDTAAATAALEEMGAATARARTRLEGVRADLLGLTTGDYPASGENINADRARISAARVDLASAGRAARAVLDKVR